MEPHDRSVTQLEHSNQPIVKKAISARVAWDMQLLETTCGTHLRETNSTNEQDVNVSTPFLMGSGAWLAHSVAAAAREAATP